MRAHRLRAVAVATGASLFLSLGAGLTVGAGSASAATAGGAATAVTATTSTGATSSAVAAVPFKGQSPAKVWALSLAQVRKASGVRARIHGRFDGEAVADIDVLIGRNGARLAVRTARWKAQVLRVGSKMWVTGDAAYWRQAGADAATARRLAGRWAPVNPAAAEVRPLSSLMTVKGWASLLRQVKPTARVAGRTIRKVPTVGLHGSGSTVYVAAKGKPYPLLEVDDNGAATIVFSDWNTKATFKAPAAKLVVRR